MTDPNRTRRVDFRLRRALESGTLPKDLLIDGPAGTGKTFGILAMVHNLCCQYPKFRALICRQTRASLTESVLATMEEDVLPAYGHEFLANGQRRSHRTDYIYPNGSRIVLAGLDKPARVLSTAWDLVYVNEAIEAQEEAWDTLGSRQDRPGRDSRFGYLIGDTNPGDPAHWLKKRCDENRTTLWQTTHAANPALYGMEGWKPAWDRYRKRLENLTGTRRKRLKDGIWSAGAGAWFETFDPDSHVSVTAEYDPRFPVHLSVDTGVHTGAVLWQVKEEYDGPCITCFGDFYSYGTHAHENARQIMAMVKSLGNGRFDVGRMDPSGNAQNGMGGTTIGTEYQRAGLKLQPWPKFPGCVSAGLAILESFVAVDPAKLRVHPRCTQLINAFPNYKRKKRGNQFIDEPEDPQHPYEEVIDALRSGLLDKYPSGRQPDPGFRNVGITKVMY